MRDVLLSLGIDGLIIVQPHIQAASAIARSVGSVVARIEPAYREYAPAIVDALNTRILAARGGRGAVATGRKVKPEELEAAPVPEGIRVTVESDYGPYETLTSAFAGYNVRVVTRDGERHEVCIRGEADSGPGMLVQAFLGDEDEASGRTYDLAYDDIAEVRVY